MNQTGPEPPSVLRAARERTRAEGTGEIDAAAASGIYAGNPSAVRAVPAAAGATITTGPGPPLVAQAAGVRAPRPGGLVAPGPRNTSELDPGLARSAAGHGLGTELPYAGQADREFSLDPLLRDRAAHAGQATACSTATNTGYPSARLRLPAARGHGDPPPRSPAPSRRPSV